MAEFVVEEPSNEVPVASSEGGWVDEYHWLPLTPQEDACLHLL